jgi:glycosyltransferase involved in cell wall biosynthesis
MSAVNLPDNAKQYKYSVVIPVYNSASIVGKTIDLTAAFFARHDLDYELILVNDGSRDRSWQVLQEKVSANPNLLAINLLRNYGQHTALLCGLGQCTGDYAVTLDDDLQNPPDEILHLIARALEGHDVVFGKFIQKKHTLFRRLGSKLIGIVNTRIFFKPPSLVASNFRILRRDVVDRMCAYQTSYPYVTGLALMFGENPANVTVRHQERPVGRSNYSLLKILELVMRILFSYSSYPLRLVSFAGMITAILSILFGTYSLIRALVDGYSVPGWATVVVLLSFLNGVLILIVSMLGEYLIRVLNQVSSNASYHVKEVIDSRV